MKRKKIVVALLLLSLKANGCLLSVENQKVPTEKVD